MTVKEAIEDFERVDSQITKWNHCEVCVRCRTDLDLFHLSSGIVYVAGTFLVVTIAYSLGWLKSVHFCWIVWFLQFYSLSEIGRWQMDAEFTRKSLRESSGVEFGEHVIKMDKLEFKKRQLEMSIAEAEIVIIRLRHQKEEEQKCHEFQLQQQLKSEEQRISESRERIQVLNADRQSLLEKELDKLTNEIQSLEKRKSDDEQLRTIKLQAVEKQLDESRKTITSLKTAIGALEVPDGSCPICFEKYSDEKHLACFVRCGHMLCYTCAEEIAANHGACHKCRAHVQKSDEIQRLYF